MTKVFPAALVVLLLAAVPVHAADSGGEKGDWELGLYGGFGWPDDYEPLEPDDDILFGGRIGYFFTPLFSLEGSFQRFESETSEFTFGGLTVPEQDFTIDSIRLNALWNFRAGARLRPFITVGVGSEKVDVEDLGDSTDLGLNAGGGLRVGVSRHFGLRFEGRYVSVDVGEDVDEKQNNIEGMFGLAWTFGGGPAADSDNDGVSDRNDSCPDTPRGAKVDAAGCPVDSDGDGVYDGIDQCADTPKGWPVDKAGCPKDGDGDGVPDGKDKCPDTPKGAKVGADGCTSDSDGDGVFDGLDRCADTPRGAKVDAYGCPVDSDHDGVPDGIDQCPDTRRGTPVDAAGCPSVPKAEPLFQAERRTLVLEGVNFETNKADITPESVAVLEKVAASLKDWPEVRVEIGGHTDSSGAAAHNQELSQRRAESVKSYLEAKGIDPSRMAAKGYGENKPVADNKTKEGRAQNRRVELTKLD
ncbi:MAG TPA: OmpA family protein [Candidatus Polarisedimenticolia bacterium]|nr:OmpA family protein [Candidatus Polarisedimenticolia bacterium]